MSTEITTVYESGLNLHDICKFYQENWPRKIALQLETFYKWQFQNNIYNSGIDHSVVAINKEKLIGIMSLNSRPFLTSKKTFKGAELSVWLIEKSYQGKGIGAKILQKITSSYDFLVGVSITEPAIPVYQRMGYIYNKYIPRVFRINPNLKLPNWINCSNLGRKLIKQRSKITEKDFTYKLIVDKYKIISECVDVIEDHHIDNNSFSIDQDYLNWRYLKHPIFKYEMFLVKNTQSKEKILVILRLHECLDGAKIAHITDIIGKFSNFKFVTPFVDKYMEENQVSAADFSCTKNSLIYFLRRSGWFSVLDEDCIYCPNLFYPIEARHPSTTSIVSKSKIDFDHSPALEEVYLTKKDCALDLPTAETYKSLNIPFI